MELVWTEKDLAPEPLGSCPGFLAPSLVELGVPHLFTTRAGLASNGLTPIGLNQVHGCGVFDADGDLPKSPPRADALFTSQPGRLLSIRVADCVPILLASSDGSRVAAVHAGWRGLVAGIIPESVSHIRVQGARAAIGPCLSVAHFEVGPEVAQAFEECGLGAAIRRTVGARPHIDLSMAARLQLLAAGVRIIDASSHCTWKHEQLFYSYRRDVTAGGQQETGRQEALIMPRQPCRNPTGRT